MEYGVYSRKVMGYFFNTCMEYELCARLYRGDKTPASLPYQEYESPLERRLELPLSNGGMLHVLLFSSWKSFWYFELLNPSFCITLPLLLMYCRLRQQFTANSLLEMSSTIMAFRVTVLQVLVLSVWLAM